MQDRNQTATGVTAKYSLNQHVGIIYKDTMLMGESSCVRLHTLATV